MFLLFFIGSILSWGTLLYPDYYVGLLSFKAVTFLTTFIILTLNFFILFKKNNIINFFEYTPQEELDTYAIKKIISHSFLIACYLSLIIALYELQMFTFILIWTSSFLMLIFFMYKLHLLKKEIIIKKQENLEKL